MYLIWEQMLILLNCQVIVVCVRVCCIYSLVAALSPQANRDSYKPIYTFKGLHANFCVL